MARSRQLQTRITMLGVGYPPDRYATLQYALQARVKNAGIDFATMQRDDLTPGEVATASIVAADTNTTPQRHHRGSEVLESRAWSTSRTRAA